mgnify:CR=1 FL=1
MVRSIFVPARLVYPFQNILEREHIPIWDMLEIWGVVNGQRTPDGTHYWIDCSMGKFDQVSNCLDALIRGDLPTL